MFKALATRASVREGITGQTVKTMSTTAPLRHVTPADVTMTSTGIAANASTDSPEDSARRRSTNARAFRAKMAEAALIWSMDISANAPLELQATTVMQTTMTVPAIRADMAP